MLDPDLLVLLIGHLSCGHTSGLHMTNVHATSDKLIISSPLLSTPNGRNAPPSDSRSAHS